MEPSEIPARPRRRWKYAALAGVVLIAIAWLAIEFAIDIDRYRPYVEGKISEFTGLPASIADLDLRLRPNLSVAALDTRIGKGDTVLVAPQIILWLELLPLFRGNIIVSAVEVQEPSLRIPEDLATAKDRLDEIIQHVKDRRKPERTRETAVNVITLDKASIYRGAGDSFALQADVTVRDVLEEHAEITFAGSAPYLGRSAQLAGDFALDIPRDGDKSLQGDLLLNAIDLAVFSESKTLTGASVSGVLDVASTGFKRFELSGDGTLSLPSYAALGESIAIDAHWLDGVLTIDQGVWQSPGLDAEFSGVWGKESGLQLHIARGTLRDSGLDAILTEHQGRGWQIEAPDGAVLIATDTEVVAKSGDVLVTRGQAHLPGVTVVRDGNVALDSATGDLTIADNVIEIKSLTSDQLELRGTVRPDLETRQTSFDLQGHASLNDALIAMVMEPGPVKDIQGKVTLEHLRGTYTPGDAGVPPDLSVQASLTGGAFTFVREDVREPVDGVTARVEATTAAIEGAVQGRTKSLGDVEGKFNYALKDRALIGSLTVPMQNAPRLVSETLDGPKALGLALAGYGESEIAFKVALPKEETRPILVELDRHGEPPLKAAFQLFRKPTGMTYGDVDVVAQFPGTALEDLTADVITVEGPVDLQFRRSDSDAVFAADIDLTNAAIRAGDLLEKPAGDNTRVSVAGTANEEAWEATTIDVEVLGERIAGRREDGIYVFDNMDVKVASVAPLVEIPSLSDALKARSAGGRITGSFRSQGPDIALQFHEVQLPITEGLAIDRLDGTFRYVDDALTIRDLTWDGLNSQFSLNARQTGQDWEGELTGTQLDINSFLAAWRELFPPDSGKAEAAEENLQEAAANKPWVQGELKVALAQVLFEDATLDNLRARVVLDGDDVLVRDLVFVPEQGEVRGRVDILHALGKGPSVYDIDIDLERVASSVIEDLREGEDRGVEGEVSGEVDLMVPEQPQGELPLAGAEGRVYLTGHDGTFGKLGLATKVLGVLKTTGVFSLRAPFSRHGGLFYKGFETELHFDDGLMQIEEGEVEASSYRMTAKGSVDFDAQQSDVRVNVDVLEGVTGLAERVPLLGKAVGLATKPFDVRLLLTGSPTDIKVRPNVGQGERLAKRRDAAGEEPAAESVDDSNAPDVSPEDEDEREETNLLKGFATGKAPDTSDG